MQSYFRAVVLAHNEVMPAVVGSRKGLICCKDLKLYPNSYQYRSRSEGGLFCWGSEELIIGIGDEGSICRLWRAALLVGSVAGCNAKFTTKQKSNCNNTTQDKTYL